MSNSYACRRILIDAGDPNRPDYIELLRNTLSDLKTRVHQVLVTHWHMDHIGGVEGVCGLYTGTLAHIKVRLHSHIEWLCMIQRWSTVKNGTGSQVQLPFFHLIFQNVAKGLLVLEVVISNSFE